MSEAKKKDLIVQLDSDLDGEFREKAYQTFKYRYGALAKAVREALKLWIFIRKIYPDETLKFIQEDLSFGSPEKIKRRNELVEG